jgi:Ca2+-binding RTX toxin-like protein
VYARRYNSAGTALSGEFQVNQTVTGEQFLPDIAVNASGAFVIAWASNQDDPGTERNDLFARRYNNAGTALSNEFKVNTYIPGEQYLHTVGIDTAGNFVVAWSSGYDDVVNPGPELQQDGNMYGVYLQRYFANGTADGGEYQVNQFTTGNQWNPSIAVRASTGNFWISWSSFGQDAANGYGIYQRQYGPNTVPTANAGGPYVINEGGSLTLSGSGTDPDFGQTLTFSWDVNGDGIYGDATGASPTLSWSQLNALGITDGPANRTVRLRTTDGFDTTTSGSTTLTVNNVAPTLGVTVQTAAVRGEVIPIALTSSDPSAADLAGTFIYQFDWNNDNAVDQIINGGSTLNTTYAFANNGTYTFKIRSIDDDGGISGWVSRTVTVTTSRTAPNPNNGSLTDLYIGGLPTDDFIIVGKGSDLGPPYGGSDLFFFNGNSGDGLIIIPNVTGRVIVYLQDGDDIFNPTNIPNATVQFGGNGADVLFGTVQSDTLDGGAGDDILVGSLDGSAAPDLMNGGDGNDFFLADAGSDTINGGNDDDVVLAGDGSNVVDGGAGNDVIVGGEGNDSLLGGTGSDFIVGLGGSDTIRGGAGQDFIIAAYIDDTPEGTAEGVVAEWFSGGSYTSRVNNITGVTNTGLNPYPLVVGVTVFDDGAADTIFGDADEDFFYLDLATDVATDVAVGEVVIDL